MEEDLCQDSISLVVKTTLASGYAAMSSSAKHAAGKSVTACLHQHSPTYEDNGQGEKT